MNNTTKWAIIISGSVLGVLILIGVIVILIKFFMKRCQKKAWDDINSLPKSLDTSTSNVSRRTPRRASTERELLHPNTPSDIVETPDVHVSIPIDENAQRQTDHTLVQIQRDRLNRLKEEENRLRPMVRLSSDEDDIQRTIDQAQKEFEESV
jgi:hypothetical protein